MRFLFAWLVLISLGVSAQSRISRSPGTSTLTDGRLLVTKNFGIPTFTDTTAANLDLGIDSSHTLIGTYNPDAIWYRSSFPKKWVILEAATLSGYTDQQARDANGYWVNVKWFNAIPNDNLNDSVAFKLAIEDVRSHGGGTIFIPHGVYNLPPLNIPTRIVLKGEGNGHASVDFVENNLRGTILLIDGVAGKSDLLFNMNTSFSGLEDLSVYNNNSVAIEAVVHFKGVLYPRMQNIEISSRVHTTGVGLLLTAATTAPNWESLYGCYLNVSVITNEAVGVHTALKIYGLGVSSRPNASRFLAGHFQGYSKSLLIDGAVPNSPPQGISFMGTTFESYYNDQQVLEYVPNSAGMNAFNHDVSRYAVKWIELKQSNQVSFFGCYFEDGNVPFAGLSDGVNGTHPAFPMIAIEPQATQTVFSGCTIVAGILDRGFATTHPNKISFLDQNSFGAIEEYAVDGSPESEISIGTKGLKAAKFRGDTTFVPRLKVEQFAIDSIRILKGNGAVLELADANNSVIIKSTPSGLGTKMEVKVENNRIITGSATSISLEKRVVLVPAEVPIIPTVRYLLVFDSTDNTLKRILNTVTLTTSLDFPLTAAGSSNEQTISIADAFIGDPVSIGTDINPSNSMWTGFVSSNGLVTIRFNNYSTVAIDPIPVTFKIKILK